MIKCPRSSLEQDESRAFDSAAARAIIGFVVMQIGVGQASVELSKPDDCCVDMLEATPRHRIQHTDCGDESDGFSGGSQELFDCFLVITGLAEHATIQFCKLVGTNDQCVPARAGNRFGFFSGQPGGQMLRIFPRFCRFVDIGRYGLVIIQKPVEQVLTIARC